MCVLEYSLGHPPSIDVSDTWQNKSSKEYMQLMFFQAGQHGSEGPQGALAFFRTRYADPSKLYPDIYMQMSSSLMGGVFKRTWNLKQEVLDALNVSDDKKHGMYITNVLLHPKSRGEIRLKSSLLEDMPLIDPKFLDHADDVRVLVEGMKLQLQLTQTKTFERLAATPSQQMLPGFEKETMYSDSYLERYVRHHTLAGYHATGTCKMGRTNDPTSVLDPELRVIGFEGLRVVDASIMPNVPSGNTSAPTVMVAEKAADLILQTNSVSHIRLPAELEEELEEKEQGRQ